MAKQFISTININKALARRDEMMIVSIGYQEYALPTKDAVTIMEILSNAERYEERYVSKDDKNNKTGDSYQTFHVYDNDTTFSAKVIPNDRYRLAKLAGKPERA
jgi:hypothetical protein